MRKENEVRKEDDNEGTDEKGRHICPSASVCHMFFILVLELYE